MKRLRILPSHNDERGAVFIIVAIFVLFVGLGVAAFAIDFGHLHVIQNELQNAADAGSLAGAGDLLLPDNLTINTGANATAAQTAAANTSGGNPVEVLSVHRGHWSFTNHEFTVNEEAVTQIDLFNTPDLDTNTDFINAVRVRTRRTSIPSFFARVLGHSSFERTAEAVAYIAPPGSFEEYEIDENIVVCKEAISDPDGNVECITGRMINSNQDPDNPGYNSGGWTNFSECENTGGMGDHVCAGGNPNPVGGSNIAVSGGEVADALKALYDCWTEQPHRDVDGDGNVEEGPEGFLDQDLDGKPEYPWNMTILVVECPDSNPGPCSKVVGAINVDVLWITSVGTPKYDKDVPVEMYDPGDPDDETDDDYWGPGPPASIGYPDETDPVFLDDKGNFDDEKFGEALWNSFVSHFGLQAINGDSAPLLSFAIYIKPACEWAEPTGGVGGHGGGFYGVLADRPVLVK